MAKIDVIRATQIATVYFHRIYKTGAVRLRIEEIEMTTDELYWLITVGYDVPPTASISPMEKALGRQTMPTREYKTLKIDANTGEVKHMKIRKI